MANLVIILVLVVILGLAGLYVYKAKKSGKKCIGCPYGSSCAAKQNGMPCSCKHDEA